MRFLSRSMIGLFLIATTIGLLAFAVQILWGALEVRNSDGPDARPARERVFAARVITVEPETIRPILTTYGEIRARRSLELRAAASGEVVFLSDSFEEGGIVKEGDLLLRIDPAEAQSALATSRADLAEAEADLRDAERALDLAGQDLRAAEDQARLRQLALKRQVDLLDRNVGSRAAVETAELAVSTANQAVVSRRQAEATSEARLEQARTALQRRRIAVSDAERRLSDTELFAPFDGVLNDVGVIGGRLVSVNERLADLVDPADLEMSFPVSTAQYARLITERGQLIGAEVEAEIDVLGLDLVAHGIISRESAVVGDGLVGRTLFARLDDAPGFRPGDFVSVRIEEPALDGVARLPASAIGPDGTVLRVGAEDRLEVVPATILRRMGNDVLIEAAGLSSEDVVAVRTPLLGEGIRIRPVRPAEIATASDREAETVSLDPVRRARLLAYVEGNSRMPDEVKARIITELNKEAVPLRVVTRLEARLDG